MTISAFPIDTVNLDDLTQAEFPDTSAKFIYTEGHINHGPFWEANKHYGVFFADAFFKPTQPDWVGYIPLSGGYGGNHALLWGCESNSTHFKITGNIYLNGTTLTSFDTDYSFKLGDPVHGTVIWDKSNILVYVNGVCEVLVAAVGTHIAITAPTDQCLFVGGSDHSKIDGYMKWLRMFWGFLPFKGSLCIPYRPERRPRATYHNGYRKVSASFLASYDVPGDIVPDHSDGLSTGTSQVITNTVVAASGITSNGNARNIVTANGMPGSPKTVTTAVTTALTTASQIATAMRASLIADTDVVNFFNVGGTGADIVLEAIDPADNDSTMNLTIEDVTSAGITEDTTAVQTTPGYQGRLVRHPGVREGLVTDLGDFASPSFLNPDETTIPVFAPTTWTEPTHDTESVPSGALLFDGFNRHNSHFWKNGTSVTLGSTEGGSLGAKTWANGTSYGCSYGRAYPIYSSDVIAHVDAEQADVSTRFAINNGKASFFVRYTDADNYVVLTVSGGTHTLTKRISGSNAQIYTTAVGATASTVRIDTDGNDIEVFINGVSEHASTTTLPVGTRVGFAMVTQNVSKMKSIEVQPIA